MNAPLDHQWLFETGTEIENQYRDPVWAEVELVIPGQASTVIVGDPQDTDELPRVAVLCGSSSEGRSGLYNICKATITPKAADALLVNVRHGVMKDSLVSSVAMARSSANGTAARTMGEAATGSIVIRNDPTASLDENTRSVRDLDLYSNEVRWLGQESMIADGTYRRWFRGLNLQARFTEYLIVAMMLPQKLSVTAAPNETVARPVQLYNVYMDDIVAEYDNCTCKVLTVPRFLMYSRRTSSFELRVPQCSFSMSNCLFDDDSAFTRITAPTDTEYGTGCRRSVQRL